MAVIITEDLDKQYGKIEALKGVTLRVEEGEIFGLLGQNGAGKTTLVKILLGITKASGGAAPHSWGNRRPRPASASASATCPRIIAFPSTTPPSASSNSMELCWAFLT